MGLWDEKITASPAFLQANELKRLVSELDETNVSNQQQDYTERAEAVADAALMCLNDNDPRLINPTALANLGSALTNAVAHFNNWLQTSNESYLTSSLQAELDSTLAFLPRSRAA